MCWLRSDICCTACAMLTTSLPPLRHHSCRTDVGKRLYRAALVTIHGFNSGLRHRRGPAQRATQSTAVVGILRSPLDLARQLGLRMYTSTALESRRKLKLRSEQRSAQLVQFGNGGFPPSPIGCKLRALCRVQPTPHTPTIAFLTYLDMW